jgi:hypothetical protein
LGLVISDLALLLITVPGMGAVTSPRSSIFFNLSALSGLGNKKILKSTCIL